MLDGIAKGGIWLKIKRTRAVGGQLMKKMRERGAIVMSWRQALRVGRVYGSGTSVVLQMQNG